MKLSTSSTAKSLSAYCLFFSFLLLAACRIYNFNLSQLTFDTFGYYLYLPVTFIYHDLGLKNPANLQYILDTYTPTSYLYQAYPSLDGLMVMKYSMGWALLNLPLFLIAHLVALLTSFPADGFSAPYQIIIGIGGLVYTLVGLVYFRKILLSFFNEKVTAAAILIIVLGTNYFQLNTNYLMLPHSYLFALYSVFIWYTIRWHQQQKFTFLLYVALSFALILLVRPVDVSAIFIFLFWGISSVSGFSKKWRLITGNWKSAVFALLIALLLVSPQLLYWKYTTGKWIYFGYSDPTGGFFVFTHPFITEVLFSFRKGWFIYTPLALFMVMGMISMFRNRFSSSWAVLIYFLIHVYLTASWSYWWYAGTLSQRPMVQSYVLLGIPLAFLLVWISRQSMLIKTATVIVISSLLLLNLFQTWQYDMMLIDSQRMTRKAYGLQFLRLNYHKNYHNALTPDMGNPEQELKFNYSHYRLKKVYFNDFETAGNHENYQLSSVVKYKGNHSLQMDSTVQNRMDVIIQPGKLTRKSYGIIKISMQVYPDTALNGKCPEVYNAFTFQGNDFLTIALSSSSSLLIPGKWNELTYYVGTPAIYARPVGMHIYCLNNSCRLLYIDNFSVDVYEPVDRGVF